MTRCQRFWVALLCADILFYDGGWRCVQKSLKLVLGRMNPVDTFLYASGFQKLHRRADLFEALQRRAALCV